MSESGETKITPSKPTGPPLENMDEVINQLTDFVSEHDVETLFDSPIFQAETGEKDSYARDYIANYLKNFEYGGISFKKSKMLTFFNSWH